jgi:hypothetical protein
MPNEPEVVKLMRKFQTALLAQEERQFREMAKAWLEVERSLEGQMSALALEIERAMENQVVTLEQVRRMERYQRLMAETRREIGKYADYYAADVIATRQQELVDAGWANAMEAVRLARPYDWQKFIGKMPVRAVENMVGLTVDGTPLAELLAQASEDGASGMTRALVQAMAQGWNPEKTARAMADGLAGGLDRALLIARTEQMRVLRESTRMGYQTSGIVLRYKRLASIGARTCIACLLADGQVYDVETDFEEHPDGRCTLVPIVDGAAEPTWQTGSQWLLGQDDAKQQEMMGAKAWEAWKDGSAARRPGDAPRGCGVGELP